MSKIREHAKGQPCCLQLFPYCEDNPETTVLAHINSAGKGMGIKSPDWYGVFSCRSCHDLIDNRMKHDIPKEELKDCILRGLYRTWSILIEDGVIEVPKDGSKAYNKK